MHIFHMRPPYRVVLSGIPMRPTTGEVLVVSVNEAHHLKQSAIDLIATLRAERPWSHVILNVENLQPDLAPLVSRATNACAVTTLVPADRRALALVLARPSAAECIADWCVERSAAAAAASLRALSSVRFLLGLNTSSLESRTTGESRRKLHARARVPSPDMIRRMHDALRGILLLQNPNETVASAAIQSGFSDAASFSTSCVRLTGVRPTRARTCVGVRWILWRWWSQARLATDVQPGTPKGLIGHSHAGRFPVP